MLRDSAAWLRRDLRTRLPVKTRAFILLLAGALAGCSPISQEPAQPADLFVATVVSDGPQPSVVVKALVKAESYRWEFYGADSGAPPFVVEGPGKTVVPYTWPSVGPGAYIVTLTVSRSSSGTGGGGGDGCCGPGPGPGNGSDVELETSSEYKVIRFAGCNELVPILFTTTWVGGITTSNFYPGQRVCVNAQESIGEELSYRITIVRVESMENPTPVAYPWATEPEYIITENPLYCFHIAGPGGCTGETWIFKVTLRIRDKHWKEATLTKFITSGCCP